MPETVHVKKVRFDDGTEMTQVTHMVRSSEYTGMAVGVGSSAREAMDMAKKKHVARALAQGKDDLAERIARSEVAD